MRIYALATIAGVRAFSMYWLGSDPQFWLPALPFLAMLICASPLLHAAFSSPWLRIAAQAALIALVVLNFPTAYPTALFPNGNEAIVAARRLDSSFVAGRYTAVTAGWSWVEYLPKVSSRASLFHLVYDTSIDGEGEEYIAALTSRLQSILATGGHVVFDSGVIAPPPSQYGAWEMFSSQRGIQRATLLEALQNRFDWRRRD